MDQWLETNPIKNPESTPEVREGHDPHHISPPNKDNSLWGFVSTDDVYSPHIETVNKGIRTAKREAEKIKSAIKEQEKLAAMQDNNDIDDIFFDPDSNFGERFEATMTNMLKGKHPSQINKGFTDLNNNPFDHIDDDNPTDEF